MGQNKTLHDRNTGAVQKRFTRYFPRLFAYLRTMTGDEAAARDAAASAFEATLREPAADENEFTLSLFAAGREICRTEGAAHDGLSNTENEIISLTFDAQLTRAQVGALLGVDEDMVTGALLSGLRKLRNSAGPDKRAHQTVQGSLPTGQPGLPA